MNLVLFGATGALGAECLRQAVDAGHQLTVLVRDAAKLPQELLDRITVKTGDVLNAGNVADCINRETDAVLFAIGVVKNSPENLCADATANIFAAMRANDVKRFIWCGGGSTLVAEDVVGFGEKFVSGFSALFMKKKHFDKEAQYQLLDSNRDIQWSGVRPLQMKKGAHTQKYRLGFNRFSGASSISFSDCADAMLSMLDGDVWLGKAPIVQY